MQCPLCKNHSLAPIELAPDLMGMTCDKCSGVWVDRAKYDAWRAKQPHDLPESSAPAQVTVAEVHKAKICPQCGHLLLPYRVGHGLSFSIDFCGACGGVWFDRDEWVAIKAKNLHDNLHDIVSKQWQTDVRQTGLQDLIEQTYARQLGTNYAKTQEFKVWLRAQPQKSLIMAYLANATQESK